MKSEILYPGAFPMVRVELAAGENDQSRVGRDGGLVTDHRH